MNNLSNKTTSTKSDNLDKPKAVLLKYAAYERIYQAIISLELKPGQYLSEGFLLEKYKVGKAAARTVLIQLEHEGLVENKGRKGHLVVPATIQDIKNIFQIRLLIEPGAARIAAGQIDEKKFAELDKRYTLAVSDTRSGIEPFTAFHIANRDFHMAIAEATDNNRIVHSLGKLLDLSMRIHYLMEKSNPDLEHWSWDHSDIREALVTGDADLAEKLVREHIEESLTKIMLIVIGMPEVSNANLGG